MRAVYVPPSSEVCAFTILMSLIAENKTVGGVGIFSGFTSTTSFREKRSHISNLEFARAYARTDSGNFVSIPFRRVRKIAKGRCVSFVMSVYLSVGMGQVGTHRTDFHKMWCVSIFSKIHGKKFNFHENFIRIKGTLYEDLCTLTIISCSFFLRMRNILDKTCRENQNIHFIFSIPPRKSCHLLDNVKKMLQPGRPHFTI